MNTQMAAFDGMDRFDWWVLWSCVGFMALGGYFHGTWLPLAAFAWTVVVLMGVLIRWLAKPSKPLLPGGLKAAMERPMFQMSSHSFMNRYQWDQIAKLPRSEGLDHLRLLYGRDDWVHVTVDRWDAHYDADGNEHPPGRRENYGGNTVTLYWYVPLDGETAAERAARTEREKDEARRKALANARTTPKAMTDDERWAALYRAVPTAVWLAPDFFLPPPAEFDRAADEVDILEVLRQEECPEEGITIREMRSRVMEAGIRREEFDRWYVAQLMQQAKLITATDYTGSKKVYHYS